MVIKSNVLNYPKGHFDHKVQTATISIPKAEIIKNISQIKAGLSFFGVLKYRKYRAAKASMGSITAWAMPDQMIIDLGA